MAFVVAGDPEVMPYIPVNSESNKRQRVMIGDLYDNDEIKSAVMKRAREVQANLAPEFPSTIKQLLSSHVTAGFCLGLNKQFCDEHLPKEDTMIVLEDENGKTYVTKYLVRKIGLGAGWRGFSIGHNLLEGDAVIFHLVRPTKLKVYIVRANDLDEEDGGLGCRKLDACLRQMNPIKGVVHAGNLITVSEEKNEQVFQALLSGNPKENIQKNSMMTCGTKFLPISDQTENENEDLGFEISDDARMSEIIVDFKEVAQYIPVKPKSHKRQRVTIGDLYDNDEVKSAVMKQAKEVQANLAPEFPSMIKHMQRSNVTAGFSLGLSKQFCNEHLPKEDTMFALEDENGKSYETKYLARKAGLSAGWKAFSTDHNLLEGDVVVFQLVRPAKFKVYIVQVNDLVEEDGALGLGKLDACLRHMNPINDVVHAGNLITASEETDEQVFQLLLSGNPSENIQNDSMMTFGTKFVPILDQPESQSEDLGFEISDGIRLSETVVDFKEVKSFEDFDILVNGLVINCELSRQLQAKYYELCCSQKLFLHEHLLEGLNCKLITGIIAETINIADALRASKLTTSQDHFVTWEKTLKSFEGLGMNVGFLIARLGQLMSLTTKSRRQKEARLERANAEEERETLEAKLLDVKKTMDGLNVEIESLQTMENLDLEFQRLAEAPW